MKPNLLWYSHDRIILLPVLHYDLSSTLAIREAFDAFQPVAAAVEYPYVFSKWVYQAIDRMPKISALIFHLQHRAIILFEPIDPFVEALRLAKTQGIRTRCVDRLSDYPLIKDALPDPYAMFQLGHETYMKTLLEKVPFVQTPEDLLRETTMAYHLQELKRQIPSGQILFICGIMHIRGILDALETEQAVPFEPRPQARLFHVDSGALGEVMSSFPFTSAVYELWRNPNAYVGVILQKPEDVDDDLDEDMLDEEETLDNDLDEAFELNALAEEILSLLDLSDSNTPNDSLRSSPPDFMIPLEKKKEKFRLMHGNHESPSQTHPTPPLRLIEGIKPKDLDTLAREAHKDVAFHFKGDLDDLLCRYILWSRQAYEQETSDPLTLTQIRLIARFARRYAAIQNRLLPDFYELLIAGRGCVNAHFCYRMWEIGTHYPWQFTSFDLETIVLTAKDISPRTRTVRMNPFAPLKPRRRLPTFLHQKDALKKQKHPHVRFTPFSICSFQPEDLLIESYGNYLRTKGKRILSEARKRVFPFETSLLDGIDLRETLRNWHTQKIYVQECQSVKGSVDSVVVIFDEDHDEKYPYRQVWYGENHQESDMAFYATDPAERPVGPGIRKAIYGGFLMTIPPDRLFNVFADPAYARAEKYAERLLLAAIDYSQERFVIYAAPKPPRPLFHTIANRYGKRILFIPLTQLSPVMLEKIRTFHVLAGHRVRGYAKDYIW